MRRFKNAVRPLTISSLILLLLRASLSAATSEVTAEAVVVEASRLPDAESAAPFSVQVVDTDELRNAPQLRLDDILRAQVPGFSLFRRNSSRTANPTTQGVTLRNFGPSGAGRTLVLLDGIPLNDPFAGYVLWSQIPPAALDSVLVQPGGGAGLFGNAALAGTIFLLSKPIEAASASVEASAGNHDTYELFIDGAAVHRELSVGVSTEHFSTGGYRTIAAGQRGPVDTNATADSELVNFTAEWRSDTNTSVRVTGRWFDDARGNGTRYTQNETVGADLSAVLTKKFPAMRGELQLSVYGQDRKFSSTFSSINATRDIETPALNQFDVPADALGGSIVWSMAPITSQRIVIGADARWVEGETNDLFRWNGTRFTSLREAGGQQVFAGLFAEDSWSVTQNTTVVGGLRFDHWEIFDGSRTESDIATGARSVDSRFADRDGNELNARLGVRLKATESLALRTAAYTGFRVPTLNELYRPFRVGNDVTEANAALKPEHLVGGEIGAEWQATEKLRLSGAAFVNRVEDAVGNVTIGLGPGTFNPGGFIPRGGVLRQRQNIDVIIAPGFEITAEWQLLPSVRLKASYLFTHPTIEEAADHAIEGKLLAQTPEHVFTGGVEWNATAKWMANAQVRYSDRQFEDDQNSRVLAPFTTIDAGLNYAISANGSAAVRVENLLNTQIQTGRTADGVLSIGTPRLVTFQLRWRL